MQAPVPTRITIDFTGDANPANAWIVGRLPGSAGRLEVVTATPGEPREDVLGPAPFDAGDCICPDFGCEHDHANE
jgi:hypothetical protein